MKITLIGQNFNENSGQGVYEYSNYLYENLKKLNDNIKKVETGFSKNPIITLWKNIFVSFYKTLKTKSDIYHFMMPEVSFACLFKRPSVVTIHDLIPLIIKNERKKSFNLYFKLMMKITLRANHLIAVSNSTKKDLIRFFNVPENKISVIYEGVDHKKFYPIKNKRKNKKFVVGYVGGLGKRKNVEYILNIAKEFKNNKNVLFKIVGKGPDLNRLVKLKREMNLDNVEFVGFIPEDKLNKFYNSLDLFIFPSYYEGFGLPVLEAMVCGIPVMVSNVSSLLEIVNDAEILINPKKSEEAVEKIKEIIKNKKLQRKLTQKSIKRAKDFNWDKTAKETVKIYETLAKK